VRDFFDAFVEFEKKLFDTLDSRYPMDFVTYHDDFGTERDTFFSEKMMEEIVFEPTKRIVDYIKSKGKIVELHSCGNITRFIPYIIDMGFDFIQMQRRAVDLPMIKEKYGDKIGINSYSVEGIDPMAPPLPKEEYLAKVRNTVDLYGKNGGYYTSVAAEADPERTWDGIWELYCYSREYYDKERGEA
jgi:uroporphyrinogen-III decarboxylase